MWCKKRDAYKSCRELWITALFKYPLIIDRTRWSVKYQTLKNRLDPGGEADNNEQIVQADAVVLAAGAWCEYLGSLVDVHIPVSNMFLV